MESSAAMTKTMRGDAEVMHGLGPVPLLQRQSAVESRWTRTVPTSRESARKIFRERQFLHLTKMEAAQGGVVGLEEAESFQSAFRVV